ncbi:hypothetical protein HDF13_004400 [Edaphobacter lichenicola]|uniref:Uncharacterized protein n=1 Tax=Tunturiibacter gelidiferens TaxID=3069689 RepID=A0ACC5P5I0_9BACT|nr:hypothetical protein [Edaphobacter lichenicola]
MRTGYTIQFESSKETTTRPKKDACIPAGEPEMGVFNNARLLTKLDRGYTVLRMIHFVMAVLV